MGFVCVSLCVCYIKYLHIVTNSQLPLLISSSVLYVSFEGLTQIYYVVYINSWPIIITHVCLSYTN